MNLPIVFCKPSRWLLALMLALGLGACSQHYPRLAEMELARAGNLQAAAPEARAASTLGTQWGEARASHTRTVYAQRLSPDRPQALAQLRYSDEVSIRRALGAHADRQLNVLLADGNVEWSVQDGQGQPLPIYRQGAEYLVAGRHGERYELVYVNRSRVGYEVVATVDGLDVLSGQGGSISREGYWLKPGTTLRIDGFRKSQSEVASFRFAGKQRAYAANTPEGDARNVGVIGSALFEVRVTDPEQAQASPAGKTPQAFPADAGSYAKPPQYRR
ncbi:S8e ribosomal protein [Comamonas composti]|uniref:membrane protein n=1 Tax=Comamonas composti TaxID=408558 RepID=UPI000401C8EC|nr:membrane protein [Comamonas composti]